MADYSRFIVGYGLYVSAPGGLERDFASAEQILVLGAHVESAEKVRIELENQIVEHGAPLVVMEDNDCGFISHGQRQML